MNRHRLLLGAACACALAACAPHRAGIASAAEPVAAVPVAAQQDAPAPVADLVAKVNIPYQQFTLDNGLRVIVHTDRKAPIVAVSVWYDVGSKHEPAGRTGFAHLYEHLMFNGSENAPGDFFGPLRAMGATDFNGTTYFDRTNYFETVPRPALDRMLFLESDRMGYMLGAITQEVLDEQRGVVQNEKRSNDNQPYGMLQYAQIEGLFPAGHPYGHSVIGSMADLDAASLDDVKSWFRSHYGPNNAVLVLAGDIDADEARPLVEKYFGAIPRGPASKAPDVTIPTLAAEKVTVLKDRVPATLIVRSWVVPGLNDPESVPLDVFASVLGGLASSRLDNALVRKEQLAVQVNANVNSLSQLGMFSISAVVRPGADPAAVDKRIDEIVADLIANGPTADEVQRVATVTVANRIRGLESVGGFGGKAVALAQGELFSRDPEFYKKRLAEVAAMTPDAVKAAAAKWLTRPPLVLRVEPGERDTYAEAKTSTAKPAQAEAKVPASAEGPAKATRGALPEVGQVADISFPPVRRARLSNGIEVIYAERKAVPVTSVQISFDVGAAADVPDRLGTQNLMLSLMDEGTESRDSIAIAEQEERLGSDVGTGSASDRTYLTLNTPSANLAPSLELLADVVRHPAFDPAEIERLRRTLLTQVQFERTDPSSLAQLTLNRLVNGNSPYAKLAAGAGDPAVLATLTRDELVAFHRAWIRPEKAKIFVASDRPLDEVRAALEARFGDWQGEGDAGAKAFDVAAQQAAPKIVLIDRPGSPQSVIAGGQMTRVDPRGDLLPLLTASDVLGEDFLSRINMELREKRHWSYGASGSFERAEHAVSYTVWAPVQSDKTGESLAALRGVIGDFLSTKGITPDEFDRTIKGAVRELAGRFETGGAVLDGMRTNDMFGRPDDYYDHIAEKYRAMTPAQLDAAARAALDPKNFVWVVVGDAKTVRPQLDRLGLPVEVVSATPAAPGAAPAN